MGKSRAQRRAARRARVDRIERVTPPPEAAQHHRPWPMQVLLAAGPEHGGIDADEFEAALQIVETFAALTQGLAVSGTSADLCRIGGNYSGSMSDRDAERIAVWFDWSTLLPRGLPPRLVRWIEDDEPVGSVAVLRRSCHLWDRVRRDHAQETCSRTVDTVAHPVLTMARGELSNSSRVNLPAQRDPVRPPPYHPRPVEFASSINCGHAQPVRTPSTARLRR